MARGSAALLALPLHVNGGIIGVLDVVNKAGRFTEEGNARHVRFRQPGGHGRPGMPGSSDRPSSWRCWKNDSGWHGSCTTQ